jgi:serine/threonine protein kinase
VNPIIKGFRKLFKKLPSNSNPAQILDSTNNYPIFHPKHPLIQESLDKIALYFQHILTNPELASSQTFKKFMNVIPSSSSSSSSSSVSEGQVADNPLLDRRVKRSKRFNEKIVLPERQNPLLSGLRGKIGLESFDIIKVLGRGCMGKVMLVTFKPTSQLFALKSIHKSSVVRNQEVEHTRSERDILVTLSRLKHPFLIQLHFSFQTATELFLVMDYYPGGDLATQLARNHRFSLDRARFYAAEMILGIEELHAHGIVYRDLKPENVLLSNTGHIVLTDFGLSKQLLGHQYLHHQQEEESHYCNNEGYYAKTFCGTAEYLAPEVLLSQNYGFSVDWWSFGTLLYEMITGITPFWAENHLEMYKRVLNDQLEFPLNLVPPLAQDLIRGLLQRDPKMRLGLQEIKDHAFFASINWMDLKALRVTPPFIPDLKSVYDLSNFEVKNRSIWLANLYLKFVIIRIYLRP